MSIRWVLPMTAALAAVLTGCDGVNFSSAGRSTGGDQASEQALLELDESLIRQPLDREIVSDGLPVPGTVPPLGPAPDVTEIERELFADIEGQGAATASYTLALSASELDVLSQSDARSVTSRARELLSFAPGVRVSSQPLVYGTELKALRQSGVRTSLR